MSPLAVPFSTAVPEASCAAPGPSARSPRAVARRRSALLQLARRHGEVRLLIGDGASAPIAAAEVSELLDDLNERGLLRYGGLQNGVGRRELVYLPA